MKYRNDPFNSKYIAKIERELNFYKIRCEELIRRNREQHTEIIQVKSVLARKKTNLPDVDYGNLQKAKREIGEARKALARAFTFIKKIETEGNR